MEDSNLYECNSKISEITIAILIIILVSSLSCIVNTIINNFQYGNNIVKLRKNLTEYNDEDGILYRDALDVNIYQALMWNIMPSICNLIIWGIGIIFIVRLYMPKNKSQNDLY